MAKKKTKKKTEKKIEMPLDDLKKNIKQEVEQRKLLRKNIDEHLTNEIDYGTIQFKTKSGKKVKSKPTLFKPGAERIMSWFGLKAKFKKDDETYEMADRPAGLFCYLCQLINEEGEIVAEGRGAAHENERTSWNENNAIKIAEKRAMVDATIRVANLSEFFTQDIEDMNLGQKDEDDKKQTSTSKTGSYVKRIDDAKDREKLENIKKEIKDDDDMADVQKKALTTRADKRIHALEGDLPI